MTGYKTYVMTSAFHYRWTVIYCGGAYELKSESISTRFFEVKPETFHTRSICNLSKNAIETQSGWLALHCKLFTSPSALYANMGSSIGPLDI
mmetsp:Transcript_16638/g.34944  ORF Transcript_16638/g.34944 Transcript_16638/m.34944 type:complete len:92 (-) Transcript_16638:1107-1382(-)